MKLAAAAALLLLAAGMAGAAAQTGAQTGAQINPQTGAQAAETRNQTGESPARARSGHSAPQSRVAPLVLPEPFAPPQEAYASFPDTDGPAAAPAVPSACQVRLGKIAAFQALGTLVGPGDCGAADAVQLQVVILPDRTKVAVTPPATLRCSMAEQVVIWLREDVAPAVAETGPPLRVLDNFDSSRMPWAQSRARCRA